MEAEKICKTVRQYSARPVSQEDMRRLADMAASYRELKSCVYERYCGIRSLMKITPGYTVQAELRRTELKDRLGLPTITFSCALFEALRDIRIHWSLVKGRVAEAVRKHTGLSEEEKHYLYFLLKTDNAFAAVLCGTKPELPDRIANRLEELSVSVDTEKLNNYLRRQVRKYHKPMRINNGDADMFCANAKSYRYGDHGIYLTTKEKRSRVFIPLTDNNSYDRQIRVRLHPERSAVELLVPVDVRTRRHPEYTESVGVAVGLSTMLTTDKGNEYGIRLGEYQNAYADWIRGQSIKHGADGGNNPGRKKYGAKKKRLGRAARLHQRGNQPFPAGRKAEAHLPPEASRGGERGEKQGA